MRVPSKAVIQKIVMRHRKKKKARMSKRTAAVMYLGYLIFLKRLAKACDNYAIEQRKLVVGDEIVRICARKVLKSMSLIESLKKTLPPELVSELVSDVFDSDDELVSDEG